ncbi:MAG: aminotransferase class V-fold PLP-dependent enzyme, partial [Nanoarchaeota archaeon]
PLEDLKINLLDHVAFLENCRKFIEKTDRKFKILFSNTRDIYGKVLTENIPIKEDFTIKEVADPQGIHNYSTEFHHLWYGKAFDFPVVSLRLTNTYGPRQKINDFKQGFLGHFIYKSLKNEEIELWGGGESLRDFNYVDDVIDAMLVAISSNKTNGQVYNLGCFVKKDGRYQEIGENICSVKEVAKKITEIAGGKYKEIPYPEEKKSIEPGHVYLDATKIHLDTGWFPKISFDEGLRKTIDFYKEHYKEYLLKEEKTPVSFLDLRQHHESLKKEIENAIELVIRKSNFILGEEGKLFEREFSNYCNKKYGIGVNSGTDAIKLALIAYGIGSGDEVILPVNTAIPCAMAIKDINAEPCFIDVDDNYLIDINKIEERINEKTKAIMPIHLYGQTCDMDKILELANKYNLEVIEDCCQAHGAEYKGKKVPIGEIGCFSFYPSKNLGALGDGGMIVTDNEELKEKLMLLRNYGQKDKYNADILGINSRLDEIQAAILRVKLKYLDSFNEKRKKLAGLYNNSLKDIKEIKTIGFNSESIYHLYVIRTRNRDELMDYLKEKQITALIHYPIPLHLQKAFSYLNHKPGDFPNAEKFSKSILSLPMFPELEEKEVRKVCEEIRNYFM